MIHRATLLGCLIASLGILLGILQLAVEETPRSPPVQGRKHTVLFLVTGEHGLSNVHFATASALLERHPHVSVHFATFPKANHKLERISTFAQKRSPSAQSITFHPLPGPTYDRALSDHDMDSIAMIGPPGVSGISQLARDMEILLSPWSKDDHLSIYNAVSDVIDLVDPAVVVLDSIFTPGIDATRMKNRLHAVISPNLASDTFLDRQPYGAMFWKYPAIGSGFSFPVPWHQIPCNMYLWLRFIYRVIRSPGLASKNAYLRANGITDPTSVFNLHRADMPWISATLPEASLPLTVIPQNVTLAGPIVLSSASLVEQDAELASWLASAPTVLINLGSLVRYTEDMALAMALTIEDILKQQPDVQVLWKFRKQGDFDDGFATALSPYMRSGRLKIEDWIRADPSSMLGSGYIIASVHHGGANCYSEAILAGVPQIVLPLWVDLYNFAALVEYLGVGLWAGRGSSPIWEPRELSKAFLKVIDGGEASVAMREEAKRLGSICQVELGRDVSASIIASLAGS